jgi:hypothetical protein
MKKSLFLALTLAAMVALIYACSKNTDKTENVSLDKTTHLLAVSNVANATTVTEVSCAGQCSDQRCSLEGRLGGDTPSTDYVQCVCTGCKMNVSQSIITGKDTTIKTTTLDGGKMPVYFLQSFQKYMQTEYPGQRYTISDVAITDDQQNNLDNYVITYGYTLASGLRSTVMFTWARMSGTTQQVDCNATTCDCRERYFPGTGAIECTCAGDCKMTISKLAVVTSGQTPM